MSIKPLNSVGGYSTGITGTTVIDANGNITGVGATFGGLVSSTVGFSGPGTNLTGNATGLTVGTASRSIITGTNSASTFYPTFVGGEGNTGLFIDRIVGPLSYIPSTATLKCTNLDLGNGALVMNATQVSALSYFYFIATAGIYLQDETLVQMGDVQQNLNGTVLEVDPSTGEVRMYNAVSGDISVSVNRVGANTTHALDVNRSDGKAIKLIYNDTGGPATNYVDLDVSSTGDLIISPSSTLTKFVGGLSAAGATLSSNTNIPAGSTLTVAGIITSDTGYRISSSAINSQTGTTYTFLESDNGKIVTFNNGSAITVTIPTGLPVGFNCTGIQLGAGQVGFTAASGVTLQSYGNQYKLIGQHASATVIEYSNNIVNLSGNLIV